MTTRFAAFTVTVLWTVLISWSPVGLMAQPRGPLDDADIAELVKQAPGEDDLPEAEAVVLFDGTYARCDKGLMTLRRQRLVRVFTENAIDELGDPRLSYDSSRQVLEIHASRTYLLDGSTMDTPENGYNEVTPFGLDLAPGYLGVREMVVTHVGMERGVSILLDWTVRDTMPAVPGFSRLIFMHDEFPALEKEVVAEGDLWGETVNPPDAAFRLPDPATIGGRLVWQAADLAPFPAYAVERLADQIPWIALASTPTWETMLAEVARSVIVAAEDCHDFQAALDVMERDEPSTGERPALERIAKTIDDRTELIRYRPWIFGSNPQSADEAYRQSSATPLERCAMVMAAVSGRGLDAALVLPAEFANLTSDVPVLDALGNPLLRVVGRKGECWFVDPVGGSVSAAMPLSGGRSYFTISGGHVDRATAPANAGAIRLGVFWDLDKGEAEADGSITGYPMVALAWEDPEGLLKEWLESWGDSVKVGKIKILESGPEALAYNAGLEASLPEPDERGRLLLDLPMPPCDMQDLLPPHLNLVHSEIDGVLFSPAPVTVDVIWRVRVPEGFTSLPGESRSLEMEGGSLAVGRTHSGRMLKVEYRFELDGRAIHPEAYAAYRGMVLDALDRRLTRLVLAEE
jgi:hypothetical protein